MKSEPIRLTPFEIAKIEGEFARPDLIVRAYSQPQYSTALRHQRKLGGGLESMWGEHRQLYIVVVAPSEHGLGTSWVAPGEGSTFGELIDTFGYWPGPGFFSTASNRTERRAICSNLKLTGAPIQDYDRERWESGNVS